MSDPIVDLLTYDEDGTERDLRPRVKSEIHFLRAFLKDRDKKLLSRASSSFTISDYRRFLGIIISVDDPFPWEYFPHATTDAECKKDHNVAVDRNGYRNHYPPRDPRLKISLKEIPNTHLV